MPTLLQSCVAPESRPLFGLVEAGGTKFVLGLATGPDDILDETRIETTSPAQTLDRAIAWLRSASSRFGSVSAIGVASFGPIELERSSPVWGSLLKTPKQGWTGAKIANPFVHAFDAPVGFDTDVNAAALAEYRWGGAQNTCAALYITVGTGIGGGAVLAGRALQGLSHPEMGHMRTMLHSADANFAGVCPFHGSCLEGLASGPAITARWGANLSELSVDHPAHDLVAYYIAQMCTTLQAVMEPEKILLGGGVMDTPGLLNRIRRHALELQNGYFRGDPALVIERPALGHRAGLLGALALAQDALARSVRPSGC